MTVQTTIVLEPAAQDLADATAKPSRGLPPTLLFEAYAVTLRGAGVPVTTVRHDGTVHGFMLLNSLREALRTAGD
jgi:acetyl esterase